MTRLPRRLRPRPSLLCACLAAALAAALPTAARAEDLPRAASAPGPTHDAEINGAPTPGPATLPQPVAPAPSAQAFAPPLAVESGAPVTVHGRLVFEVRAPNGSATAAERARAAESILTQVASLPDAPEVTVVPLPHGADEAASLALKAGGREVLRIGPEDAARSGLSIDVYAESIAAAVNGMFAHEHRRVSQQHVLQSVAMTVFLGLLAFLALRWIEDAARRARVLVEERLSRDRGLMLRDVQIVSPETLQGTSYALVGIVRIVLQFGLLYAYVAFALAEFDATRGWVGPLTRVVTSPFLSLVARVGELVPLAILVFAGAYVVRGLLRLSGFLLERVGRGEYHWTWLPQDLAVAVRPLARLGLVVGALLLFGPLVGVGTNSLLTHLGLLALGAAALGAVPLAAAATVGTFALFGRRYRIGEWLVIGPHTGEVTEIGFFDLTLVPIDAGRLHVSHLLTLWLPVRHLPGPPALELELPAAPTADPSAVLQAVADAFEPAKRPQIELRALTPGAAIYRLRFAPGAAVPGALASALSALLKAGLAAPQTPQPQAVAPTGGALS